MTEREQLAADSDAAHTSPRKRATRSLGAQGEQRLVGGSGLRFSPATSFSISMASAWSASRAVVEPVIGSPAS